MQTVALLLAVAMSTRLGTPGAVQRDGGSTGGSLQANVPLVGEWVDIGRTVRYDLRGLSAGSYFEVRVSYPAVVRSRTDVYLDQRSFQICQSAGPWFETTL